MLACHGVVFFNRHFSRHRPRVFSGHIEVTGAGGRVKSNFYRGWLGHFVPPFFATDFFGLRPPRKNLSQHINSPKTQVNNYSTTNARAAYKPDSVLEGTPPWMAIHLDGGLPRRSCCLPGFIGRSRHANSVALNPYLALLLVGLAVPLPSPATRWALTPPFHPCPACEAVCFLRRFPSGFPGRALPGTLASRSPDFPRTGVRARPSGYPRRKRILFYRRTVNN